MYTSWLPPPGTLHQTLQLGASSQPLEALQVSLNHRAPVAVFSLGLPLEHCGFQALMEGRGTTPHTNFIRPSEVGTSTCG